MKKRINESKKIRIIFGHIKVQV